MSAQDIRVVSGGTSTFGISFMLYLIFLAQLGMCAPTKVKLEDPVVCECRCAP